MISADNRYPGGKGVAGLSAWIVSHMRTHAHYAELFAGKAAVFRHKPFSLTSLLIDLDEHVVSWLQKMSYPGATVKVGDAACWLRDVGPTLDDDWLLYLDPPYLPETRVKKRIYNFEMTIKQHIELLEAALIVSCGVMISGYPSKLYEKYLGNWHRFETQAMTRGGVFRTEVLWVNYDPAVSTPQLTVEYSGLGDNFRERDRVARKIKRWRSKLLSLPASERRVLLLSLLDIDL